MGEADKSGKNRAFKTQLGLTSTVTREQVTDEKSIKANHLLADIGALMNPIESLTYMGSAAVHVYYSEILQQIFVATQADGLIAHKCPGALAQVGITDLTGTIMEKYGMKRPTKRNGF